MANNNIGVADLSYIDSQAELLIELINKSKTENEKIEYAKDTLTAVAREYFRKGANANSKCDNKFAFIGEEYPPLGVYTGTPGTNDGIIKPMGKEK